MRRPSLAPSPHLPCPRSILALPSRAKKRERRTDRRVVLVDKVTLDELDRESALADSSAANDDELVFT